MKVHLFIYLWEHGMWDLSFQPQVKPTALAVEVWSLNNWTTQEVPEMTIFEPRVVALSRSFRAGEVGVHVP